METPRIGIAAIGGKGWMGGANYVRNLAAAIHAFSPETPISWFCGEQLEADWRDVTPRWTVPPLAAGKIWFRRPSSALGRQLKEAGVNFLYPLTYDNTFNLALDFPVSKALRGCRWAGWVPDFQHRHLPELFTEEERRWRDAQIPRLAREAPVVALSSRHAVEDFERFYPEFAAKAALLQFTTSPIPPEGEGVIAPSDDEKTAEAIPERFFLICNQFWRHKNHAVAFDALRLLRSRGISIPVLCTGELLDYRSDDYARRLETSLNEGGLREQVTLLGLIPRERQVALMRRAVAIIQPSLFEGWSTVVEDARALGRPCLLSDIPVHREQNPPGSRFFEPTSAEELAALIEEAWRDWPAGPDAARESEAHAEAVRRQRDFGQRFLALASRVLGE